MNYKAITNTVVRNAVINAINNGGCRAVCNGIGDCFSDAAYSCKLASRGNAEANLRSALKDVEYVAHYSYADANDKAGKAKCIAAIKAAIASPTRDNIRKAEAACTDERKRADGIMPTFSNAVCNAIRNNRFEVGDQITDNGGYYYTVKKVGAGRIIATRHIDDKTVELRYDDVRSNYSRNSKATGNDSRSNIDNSDGCQFSTNAIVQSAVEWCRKPASAGVATNSARRFVLRNAKGDSVLDRMGDYSLVYNPEYKEFYIYDADGAGTLMEDVKDMESAIAEFRKTAGLMAKGEKVKAVAANAQRKAPYKPEGRDFGNIRVS